MIRIKRGRARKAVAVDQQQDLAVLGYGALASGEHDFPHVQGNARIKVLLGVERLVAGMANEIISNPKAISVLRYCNVKPYQRSSQSRSESPKPACFVVIVGSHDKGLHRFMLKK